MANDFIDDEVTYISGVSTSGKIVAGTFGAWAASSAGAPGYSEAGKWGSDIAGTSGGTVSYYFDPSSNWSSTEQQAFKSVLALWSAEVNISFVQSFTPGGITFARSSNGSAGAVISYMLPHPDSALIGSSHLGRITDTTISIDTSVPGFGPIGDSFSTYGGYPWMVLFHEVGHSIGLGHGGPYDEGQGSPYYNNKQSGVYDSRAWTIMSYLDPDNPNATYYNYTVGMGNGNAGSFTYNNLDTYWGTTSGSYNVPVTPMMVDILAAQRLYGAPVNSPLSGGQVFGFNSNITGDLAIFFDFTQNSKPIVTLFSTGTNNTLDLSGFSGGANVNLNPGTFSSFAGLVNNVGIAYNTWIDTYYGASGNNVVQGNNNGNRLYAGNGNDQFSGGAGSDTFSAGTGTNVLDGRGGLDTAVYSGNKSLYTIQVSSPTVVTISGNGLNDTLTSVEFAQFADQTVDIGSLLYRVPNDFNGDNRSDLLLQDDNGQARLWFIDGTSLIGTANVNPSPAASLAVEGVGNFFGDGNTQILFRDPTGPYRFWSLNGAARAGETSVSDGPNGFDPTWRIIDIADFNNDLKSDILWQNASGAIRLWVMNGFAISSSFTPPGLTDNSIINAFGRVIAAGDVNDDGYSDILWQHDSGKVAVSFLQANIPAGQGAPPVRSNMGANVGPSELNANPGADWKALGLTDFDGDGKADIYFQHANGQAMIWFWTGTFANNIFVTNAVSIADNPGSSWRIKGAEDFDGDGRSDFVWQNDNGQVAIWLMNGASVKSAAVLGSDGAFWQVANDGVANTHVRNDYDGDGRSDILWQKSNGQVSVWLMNGKGIVTGSGLASDNPGAAWKAQAQGDFNGDGKTDILFRNINGQSAVWLMNGRTVGAGSGLLGDNPGAAWQIKLAGDFDGDGKADILWQNNNGQAAIWFMDGTGIRTGSGLILDNPGASWRIKSSGDFDGDGKADILWQNDSGQAAIWLMDGKTAQAGSGLAGSNPGTAWQVKSAGDFNGDGKSDILWQNANGQAAIWLMNGSTMTSGAGLENPGASWRVQTAADYNGDGRADILWRNDNGQSAIWTMSALTQIAGSGLISDNPGATWTTVTG